jgi:uncharacterized membrane protein YphA (DoxX/SURF4 family)
MELSAFAADPVTVGTLIGALALVMFAAAWHKFSEPDTFAGALTAYRLLPQQTVNVVARALPVLEVLIGACILLPATRTPALIALTALVLLYATAIGFNLVRGRRDIDCGCGGESHPLSWGLVLRNLVLAAAALIASRPTLERSMDWMDALTLVLGVLAFYAFYLMADELLRQASRLARFGRDGHEHGKGS